MDTRLKIFLACALGAFIGALTALEINGYFWWLGCIVGGVVGYFIYELNTVLAAIPRAWRAATSWRPNMVMIKLRLSFGFGLFCMSSSFIIFFGSIIIIGAWDASGNPMSIMTVSIISICICGFMFLLGMATKPVNNIVEYKQFTRECILYANPVAVYIYWPVVGIILGIKNIPRAIRVTCHASITVGGVTATFTKKLFLLIHSEERLLCGVWAATGSLIGYFAGSAIIGAAAGGLLGVADYEIISKRVLHLVPSPT